MPHIFLISSFFCLGLIDNSLFLLTFISKSFVSRLIFLLPKGPFMSSPSSLIDRLTSFGIKIFFLPIFDIKIPYK